MCGDRVTVDLLLNTFATLQGGGGSKNNAGCVSYGCKLDLVTMQEMLTGEKYDTNILNPIVVQHFDNYPVQRQPVYMDDTARHRRAGVVLECLQQQAIGLSVQRSTPLNTCGTFVDVQFIKGIHRFKL